MSRSVAGHLAWAETFVMYPTARFCLHRFGTLRSVLAEDTARSVWVCIDPRQWRGVESAPLLAVTWNDCAVVVVCEPLWLVMYVMWSTATALGRAMVD